MAGRTLSVEGFLPYAELPRAADGSFVQVRETAGKTTVLVTLHSAACAGCVEYLGSLAPIAPEFDIWDARLVAIVPGPVADARRVNLPFGTVLADEHASIAGPGSASVIVADRYAQIFEAVHAGASHQLLPPRAMAEWLKFLGTLCPE